ncbi:MAG: ABC transporter substrate-binding protein [Candidatus Aphodomorpha sp.]
MKKILAMLLALCMVLALVACKTPDTAEPTKAPEVTDAPVTEPEATAEPTQEPEAVLAEQKSLAGYEYGKDYISLYEQFGKEVTIADVEEDPETGFAYITKDGVKYELGLDFLTMAMVYNVDVPEGGEWATADDVYATWWKLYMQRWNYLLPEIPLYSNEYYDLYNAQIKGVEEHPTNPYWSPSDALIDWTSEKADNSIIIGNTTDLSGKFRYAAFGGTNPGAADLDVQEMIIGLETVATTKEGGYQWNDTVVKAHEEAVNDDGTKTFTITLHDDLKFSDGSSVTAKDYIAFTMAFSSPVAAQAAGKDHRSGMTIAGYDTFATYDGTEGSGTKEFSGLRLIDDLTFSVTIAADYIPYFYDITYAGFSAQARKMWIGDADILDDGNGVYFTDDFYAKADDGEKYVTADLIVETSRNTDSTYPYSGPYMVESYDDADKSAVLVINPEFKGNYEGAKPSIEKVVYKKIISKTQLQDLQAGNLDCISGITGGDETNEALAMADASNGAYVYTHYSRAGYGKLGMRCDYGPVQFTEVRQAIAYCMDRAKFAKDFTGGYGGVVDGPYYSGSWMYKAAVDQGMLLNAYSTSVDSAIAVLEEGGWVYDAEGNDYVEGVRYKKIPASEATENDINYKSKDGAYVTTKVGDDYYMPLALNWYGTADNPFTDQLMTGFLTDANIIAAGFNVQNTIGDFAPMLDELYQMNVYGYYSGTPMYGVFNFATGFTSAAYDYSYNMTIDPSMYDDYSAYYIKDLADAYWLS